MMKSSHSVVSISFTWAQQHMVSFVTFKPHTHTCSPTQHRQKCQDIHRNVLAKLHAEAALAVAKPARKGSTGHGRGNRSKASQTLSESRQENYGITATNVTPCSVRSSRQPIDYMSLNDGYEDETLSLSKKRRKESHRPRSAPSATRLSAHKRMNSPESTALDGDNPTTDTFTVIPTPSTSTLEGIPNVDEQLPDLVLPPTWKCARKQIICERGKHRGRP